MVLYYHAVNRHYQKIRDFMQSLGLLLGVGFDEREKKPLSEFPNDVRYFSKSEVEDQLRYWSELVERANKRGKTLEKHRIWDAVRAKACLGEMDVPARRCSMNNRLWELWLTYRELGKSVTLEDVKKWVDVLMYSSMAEKSTDEAMRNMAHEKLRGLLHG